MENLMMKKRTSFFLSVLLLFVFVIPLQAQEQTIGLISTDSEKSYQGYTLFAPKHYHTTHLIDNDGYVVNSWEKSIYEPGQSVYLLENGNLLRCCFKKGSGSTGGGEGGRIEEYDWDDNLVWEFDYSSNDYMSHHDIEPLPNGNVLLLAVEKKTYQETLEAGFNPDNLQPDIQSNNYMLPDYVIEVEPTPPVGGNIVWEWHVWDHLVQDYDVSKENYADPAAHPELNDANGSGGKVSAFWNHMNSIDYNPELDQIIMSVRGNSELWIIDHGTTSEEASGHSGGKYGKGGDLLYRWGNPSTYGAGDDSDQQLFQQHDTQWIEPGCPGEGNMLIFNNGLKRSDGDWSSVDEIVPPDDENRFYSLTAGSAFGPESILWTYYADNKSDFYAEAISGAQRLPNGNTLICDGTHGRLFEVTTEGEIVWDYINPVVKEGPLHQGEEPQLDHRGHQYNAVFKIHRYPQDYPAFDGKDLTPGKPLEIYPTGIENYGEVIPFKFNLNQNYPNPFNPETTISFTVPKAGKISLKIYNVLGENIDTIVEEFLAAGNYSYKWQARRLPSGIYYYTLKSGSFSEKKKMVLIR